MEIKKPTKELKILKIMLRWYILLALILAGLNYGYVSKALLLWDSLSTGSGIFMRIGLKPYLWL